MLIVLAIVVAGYLGLLGLLFSQQRKLLYPAPRERLASHGVMQRLVLTAPSGATPALLLPAAPGKPTVAFFHGNGGQLADAEWLAVQLSPHGLGLFSVEYPGYPDAAGEPSEKAIVEAAVAGLEQSGLPKEQWVLLGQSLGTGVAVELARRGFGRKVLLLSPFTALPDVAKAHFPVVPGFLMLDRFDSASKAPGIALPVLVIHGTKDEVVPFALGKRLSGRFPHAAFEAIDGAGHNDLIDRPEVLKRIVDFALSSP